MYFRVLVVLVLVVLGAAAFYAYSPPAERPTTEAVVAEPALTPEAAKQALLARMKGGRSYGLTAEQWAQMEVGAGREGWHDFGGNFRINPAARKYTLWYGPPPEVKGCTFEFEGTFSLRDGVWVADDPVEVKSSLGGGN